MIWFEVRRVLLIHMLHLDIAFRAHSPMSTRRALYPHIVSKVIIVPLRLQVVTTTLRQASSQLCVSCKAQLAYEFDMLTC
jgi:hypothetical protein